MRARTIILIIFIALLVIIGLIFGAIYLVNKSVEDTVDEGADRINEVVENEMACLELGCPSDTVYVGSKNSDKYYECKCGWARTINPENILCFKDDMEAQLNGYVKSEC